MCASIRQATPRVACHVLRTPRQGWWWPSQNYCQPVGHSFFGHQHPNRPFDWPIGDRQLIGPLSLNRCPPLWRTSDIRHESREPDWRNDFVMVAGWVCPIHIVKSASCPRLELHPQSWLVARITGRNIWCTHSWQNARSSRSFGGSKKCAEAVCITPLQIKDILKCLHKMVFRPHVH